MDKTKFTNHIDTLSFATEELEQMWIESGKDPNEKLIPMEISSKFKRSEERRVGKECRSRWSPYH